MLTSTPASILNHKHDTLGTRFRFKPRSFRSSGEAGLRAAIARIAENVGRAKPDVVIDGYELQEQVVDGVEAMAGFTAAPPFGPLVVVGSGGTLVEVLADRAVKLAPFDHETAHAMIESTKLAKILGGYRNLMPKTDLTHLVDVVVKLSCLASDLNGAIVECDINPVVVHKGTGDVRIVDALCISAGENRAGT